MANAKGTTRSRRAGGGKSSGRKTTAATTKATKAGGARAAARKTSSGAGATASRAGAGGARTTKPKARAGTSTKAAARGGATARAGAARAKSARQGAATGRAKTAGQRPTKSAGARKASAHTAARATERAQARRPASRVRGEISRGGGRRAATGTASEARQVAELEHALTDARADARAARDEVARLSEEADALRERLDARGGTEATAGEHGGHAHHHEAVRHERHRSEEAARTWREQLVEAQRDAARERARAHELEQRLAATHGGTGDEVASGDTIADDEHDEDDVAHRELSHGGGAHGEHDDDHGA